LRAALFPYLFARHEGGTFILRVEDTDQERLVEGAVENLLRTLAWAGIVPDEGPYLDTAGQVQQRGNFGPYVQSERLPLYKKYAEELITKEAAYYCFCTSERLQQLREEQQAKKLPTKYDRHCAAIPLEESRQRVGAGESHVIRLKMPSEGETVFNDLVRGEVRFKNELIDDQVLLKSDGFPTYHLAVVVDDHLMEITHVIRGEDWISSTPKHLQLYKYFGWDAPVFGHLPLILNPDKSKLSKRQGDVAVEDYQKKGYLPEALVNFIAFLGWNPGDERELFTLDELIKEFSLAKVSKAGAVFNVEKLGWYNKEYLKRLSNEALVVRALPFLVEAGHVKEKNEWLADVLALEKERVTTLAEFPEALTFIFQLPSYPPELLVWKKSSREEALTVLSGLVDLLHAVTESSWVKENLEKLVLDWTATKEYQKGAVLSPLRVALSGQQNSPGPFEIAAVLGKSESLHRLKHALGVLS
jgi:glutamyl-tRNA synthetase